RYVVPSIPVALPPRRRSRARSPAQEAADSKRDQNLEPAPEHAHPIEGHRLGSISARRGSFMTAALTRSRCSRDYKRFMLIGMLDICASPWNIPWRTHVPCSTISGRLSVFSSDGENTQNLSQRLQNISGGGKW